MVSKSKFSPTEIFAIVFGLFLGLSIWKFGNPVILDQKIYPPQNFEELWNGAWPTHWANWMLPPLAIAGLVLLFRKIAWSSRWLWLLPLTWFGWQLVSAMHSVDSDLTTATLFGFFGCVACYFLGAFLSGRDGNGSHQASHGSTGIIFRAPVTLLLAGILVAFVFCLVRAVDQRLYEFPTSRQMLIEGERTGWTNASPETLTSLRHDHVLITTNGAETVNPVILAKFTKARVNGTLVYPNALAGIILMLFPATIVLTFRLTRTMRPVVGMVALAVIFFLGVSAFFWTGSKLGWLIALVLTGLYLFRLKWPVRMKAAVLAVVLIAGLGVFAVRFHNYFASGATSVGARFDYWHAAVKIAATHPLLGTGPGTFQHPYEHLKSPDAEMARLAHNDYLEQFSDSGIVGGVAYVAWVLLALAAAAKGIWKTRDPLRFALFVGVLGWFIQGLGEFGLYVPALAWTAFALLGTLTLKPIEEKF